MADDRPLSYGEPLRAILKVKREPSFNDQHRRSHQIVAVLSHARRRKNHRSCS
jgi:hypothetical protein